MSQSRRDLFRTLNELAVLIRKEKSLEFGEVCRLLKIGSSTLYGYIRILNDLYKDVRYEKGRFIKIEEPKVIIEERKV